MSRVSFLFGIIIMTVKNSLLAQFSLQVPLALPIVTDSEEETVEITGFEVTIIIIIHKTLIMIIQLVVIYTASKCNWKHGYTRPKLQ